MANQYAEIAESVKFRKKQLDDGAGNLPHTSKDGYSLYRCTECGTEKLIPDWIMGHDQLGNCPKCVEIIRETEGEMTRNRVQKWNVVEENPKLPEGPLPTIGNKVINPVPPEHLDEKYRNQ